MMVTCWESLLEYHFVQEYRPWRPTWVATSKITPRNSRANVMRLMLRESGQPNWVVLSMSKTMPLIFTTQRSRPSTSAASPAHAWLRTELKIRSLTEGARIPGHIIPIIRLGVQVHGTGAHHWAWPAFITTIHHNSGTMHPD